MLRTRREMLKLAAGALPASHLLANPALALGNAQSDFGGVQVGIIAPYAFRGTASDVDAILAKTRQLGLSAVEMQSDPVEAYAGAPTRGGQGGRGGRGRGGPGGRGRRGGGSSRMSRGQRAAVTSMNESLAPLNEILAIARSTLNSALYAEAASADAIKRSVQALASAELALANARAEGFAKLQASANKLNPDQVAALSQSNAGGRRGGRPGPAGGRGGRGGGRRGPGGSPEQDAARRARGEEMRKWRLSVSMDKYKAIRKKYEDAGVAISIVKFGLGPNMSDEEVDYSFRVAKALGCRAITCEPPVSATRRLGQFADRHQIMLGYHNHSNATSVENFCRPGAWEQTFFYSKYNGANVDIGHFTAGNSFSPIDFIKRYAHRITNLHLKDRRNDQGPNVPWGEGDTQIKEILQLMKREKYPFMATIELEYPTPEGSDVMTELAKCVQYCKDALA